MARVGLHGTGEDEGYLRHYQDTIARARSLEGIEPFLSDDELTDLREIYPDERRWVWGSEPDPDRLPQNDPKVKNWKWLVDGTPVRFMVLPKTRLFFHIFDPMAPVATDLD